MPTHVTAPTRVEAAGNKPKLIDGLTAFLDEREGLVRGISPEHHWGVERRLDERHDDLEEDAQFAGAVNAAGVDVVIGHGQSELAHEKDAERGHGEGDDQAGIGVDPAKAAHDEKEGDENGRKGHHDGGQNEDKEHVFARVVELGQTVPDHGREDEIQQHHGTGHNDAVHEIAAEVEVQENLGVVVPLGHGRKELQLGGKEFLAAHERGGDHVQGRQRKRDGAEEQRQLAEDSADDADGSV